MMAKQGRIVARITSINSMKPITGYLSKTNGYLHLYGDCFKFFLCRTSPIEITTQRSLSCVELFCVLSELEGFSRYRLLYERQPNRAFPFDALSAHPAPKHCQYMTDRSLILRSADVRQRNAPGSVQPVLS